MLRLRSGASTELAPGIVAITMTSGARVVLVAASVVVLAACGGGDAGTDAGGSPIFAPVSDVPDDAHTVRVRAGEFFFDPAGLTVPADQPVALTLQNFGQVQHDWLALAEGDRAIVGAYVYADVGETTTGVFALEAGTYTVICTISGHREAGMVGTVTAT
jgi:plastocyanin